jgi:aryl-alcohol dehydrogenase-like predicted oxidoreductase
MSAFEGISLGCGNFGGVGSSPAFFGKGISEDEAWRIMDHAWESGLHWFDTADAYGGGRSESFIGRWRADRKPDGLRITTKTFNPMDEGADHGLAPDRIRRQLEGSLDRLGVDRIDLYLAHEPDSETPLAASVETFEELVAEGVIGAWGVSNFDVDLVRETLALGRPSLVQNPFSLLDRGDEEALLPLCLEEDISYVPFGPLAGGWLTGKYRRGEPYPEGSRMTQRPEPYERLVADRVYDGLDRLREEAAACGVDLATLAFAWVLATPGVTGAVCGPSRAAHLDPVLAALELPLDHGDHERIGGFFS